MSSGPLTQLAAIGAQDCNFLSNDPNDSIFKESNSKKTNFVKATTCIRPQGKSAWGKTLKFKILKEGDLLNSIYFVAKLPEISNSNLTANHRVKWGDYVGNLLIENIKLYIGGQLIDEQSGDFIQIYTDMYDDDGNKMNLIGMDGHMNSPQISHDSTHIYVPLKFWFCESLSKSLPIIALQYHEIEIEVKLRNWKDCVQALLFQDDNDLSPGPLYYNDTENTAESFLQPLGEVRLDCNYIYLTSEERKKIAQEDHKILITQTQKIKHSISQSNRIELNFNHPVKEIYFYIRDDSLAKRDSEIFNFSNKPKYMTKDNFDKIITDDGKKIADWNNLSKDHYLESAEILINGHIRAEKKDYKYYHYLQNYEYFKTGLEHYIYLYSFSGNPRSGSPVGSLNFSRVDNAQLKIDINNKAITNAQSRVRSSEKSSVDKNNLICCVFAINYNYLVIKNGMAGLMYNN